MSLRAFEFKRQDGKLIRGDGAEGTGRQILFIAGLLSKRFSAPEHMELLHRLLLES